MKDLFTDLYKNVDEKFLLGFIAMFITILLLAFIMVLIEEMGWYVIFVPILLIIMYLIGHLLYKYVL